MKRAVFPGSFDPFTFAHQRVVLRALALFDEIYIAVGVNSAKQGLIPHAERLQIIQAIFADYPQIVVQSFEGLTVHYCKQVDAQFILRGLRNSNDFIFENAIAQNNLIMAPRIETYFLVSESGTAHISSTIVRDVLANQGDISTMVPAEVITYFDGK